MVKSGQIVLFRFPNTDLSGGKLRPALVLRRVPGKYDDWLICMVSSQLQQAVVGFDEVVKKDDPEFKQTGLKVDSVIRLGRMAVVDQEMLLGAIGHISAERFGCIAESISDWIKGA